MSGDSLVRNEGYRNLREVFPSDLMVETPVGDPTPQCFPEIVTEPIDYNGRRVQLFKNLNTLITAISSLAILTLTTVLIVNRKQMGS